MTAANGGSHGPKYPIVQLSGAVDRFIKILRIDLDRLQQHKKNIHKHKVLEDWQQLNKEQINATQTVQQLKANIKELEKTRTQIQDCDIPQFDRKVQNIKKDASDGILDFLESHLENCQNGPILNPKVNSMRDNSTSDRFSGLASWHGDVSTDPDEGGSEFDRMAQSQLLERSYDDLEKQRLAEESWDNLRQSLEEVSEMMQTLSSLVHVQQEKVDSIDDNIERAQQNVDKGTSHLAKAAKWKAAIFPVAGAVIGGIIAGPIGLYAGAKIGGVAGLVGGGVAGFTSGKFVQRKTKNSVEMEMKDLQQQKAAKSNPELSLEDLKKPRTKKSS